MNFRVFVGSRSEIEDAINNLDKDWFIKIAGMSATNETISVIVQLTGKKVKL